MICVQTFGKILYRYNSTSCPNKNNKKYLRLDVANPYKKEGLKMEKKEILFLLLDVKSM